MPTETTGGNPMSEAESAGVDESTKSFLMGKIIDLEEEVDALREQRETRIQTLERRNKELERRVAELEDRTDMLQLVENADEMDASQRSTALLQHLQRKAEKKGDRGKKRSATINRHQAEETLHYPDLDRTTFYTDMQRVARWIDDNDVCWYDDGELVLDLEAGDVPRKLNGGD
jgi:DNA-binding transcriptional MerR regulator